MRTEGSWDSGAPGVLKLPSGRLVRGRGLRRPAVAPDAAAEPQQQNSSTPGARPARRTPAEAVREAAARPSSLDPDFGLYLLGSPPPAFAWTARWLRWPDFRLPGDKADAIDAITEAWRRAENERVEVACGGGHGRTGTALACMAVLDGVAPRDAVAYVRAHYDPHAVEMPWQHRFVRRFARMRTRAPRP